MDTATAPSSRGCRFPVEIIAHCVWLYFRFCLSFRDVQERMLERGVEVSHEGIRLWTLKFGSDYARGLRRGGRRYGDSWHLDEVFCKINGQLVYLWRAVDQDGETLDILVQKRRNAKAAQRFLRKLLKGLHYVPRAMVTDKLTSSAVFGVFPIGKRSRALGWKTGPRRTRLRAARFDRCRSVCAFAAPRPNELTVPERFPERGLKERRSCLPRNAGIASGESMRRKPGGWDEADVGAARDDALVGVHGRYAVRIDPICRTAIYVTRLYGGVGGGDREVFPYPE
jgi:hypothetical protein